MGNGFVTCATGVPVTHVMVAPSSLSNEHHLNRNPISPIALLHSVTWSTINMALQVYSSLVCTWGPGIIAACLSIPHAQFIFSCFPIFASHECHVMDMLI